MPLYKLKDDGYPTFKKITTKGKWVGRVCKTTTGYLGLIGHTQFRANTEVAAFDGVVAKHLGFADVEDLKDNNRTVRAKNQAKRTGGQYITSELISGNFEPFTQMLERMKKEEG